MIKILNFEKYMVYKEKGFDKIASEGIGIYQWSLFINFSFNEGGKENCEVFHIIDKP